MGKMYVYKHALANTAYQEKVIGPSKFDLGLYNIVGRVVLHIIIMLS